MSEWDNPPRGNQPFDGIYRHGPTRPMPPGGNPFIRPSTPGQPRSFAMTNRRPASTNPEPKVTRRTDTENYVLFALDNPDSEAAANLGLEKHGIDTPEEKKKLAAIVGQSNAEQPGFLSRMWDNIAVFFQCLMGMITGECGFGDFSRLIAERRNSGNAEKTYKNLAANGYPPELARSISGVEPVDPNDPKKGLKPIKDSSGQYTGIYGREVGIALKPGEMKHKDAMDAGLAPSKTQIDMYEAIYQDEMARLYTDKEKRTGIEAYRADLKARPARDVEAETFVKENRAYIEAMADRMIASDEELKGAGFKTGKFDYRAHREQIIQQLEARMLHEHKKNFDKYAGVAPPAEERASALGMVHAVVMPEPAELANRMVGSPDRLEPVKKLWRDNAFIIATGHGIKEKDAKVMAAVFADNVVKKYQDPEFNKKTPEEQAKEIRAMLRPPFKDNQVMNDLVDVTTPTVKQAMDIAARTPVASPKPERGSDDLPIEAPRLPPKPAAPDKTKDPDPSWFR